MTDDEKLVLAHRYLYYVLAEPVLPDAAYDALERRVMAATPETSPVHNIGSSLPSDYNSEIRTIANKLQGLI